MAYGVIPRPGTAFGPCVEHCEHRDCEASRAMTAAVCPHCGKPIGYDERFVSCGADGYAHWVCALEDAERHPSQ